MKKKNPTRTTKFQSIKLYREDLEEITNILHSHVIVMHLSDNEFEYENLDDLKEGRGEVFRNLLIDGIGTDCSVQLKLSAKLGNELTVYNEDEVFLSLQDLLRKRQR